MTDSLARNHQRLLHSIRQCRRPCRTQCHLMCFCKRRHSIGQPRPQAACNPHQRSTLGRLQCSKVALPCRMRRTPSLQATFPYTRRIRCMGDRSRTGRSRQRIPRPQGNPHHRSTPDTPRRNRPARQCRRSRNQRRRTIPRCKPRSSPWSKEGRSRMQRRNRLHSIRPGHSSCPRNKAAHPDNIPGRSRKSRIHSKPATPGCRSKSHSPRSTTDPCSNVWDRGSKSGNQGGHSTRQDWLQPRSSTYNRP